MSSAFGLMPPASRAREKGDRQPVVGSRRREKTREVGRRRPAFRPNESDWPTSGSNFSMSSFSRARLEPKAEERKREKERQAEEGLKGPRTLTACLHFSFLFLSPSARSRPGSTNHSSLEDHPRFQYFFIRRNRESSREQSFFIFSFSSSSSYIS